MDKAKAKERREQIKAQEEKERKITEKKLRKSAPKTRKTTRKKSTRNTSSSRQSDGIGETLIKELTRGLFGILGMKR